MRSCATANGPDQRLGRRPHAAGQDDRLVAPAGAVEDVRDADRVRHDRDAGDRRRRARRARGSSCRPRSRSPCRARRGRAAAVGDRLLLDLLERGLGGEPGLEQRRVPESAVAPPWTFSSRPCSWRISRSRRTVMSDTPSSRARSATRTAPVSRTRSRISAWRCRASIQLRSQYRRAGTASHRRPPGRCVGPTRVHLDRRHRAEVNEFEQESTCELRASLLTSRSPRRNNRTVAQAPPMRRGTGPPRRRSHGRTSTAFAAVTRRQRPQGRRPRVAALGGVSAFLAACSSTGATAAPAHGGGAATAGTRAGRAPPRRAPASGRRPASVTLGSNYSDAVPKGDAWPASSTRSRQQTGITVKINTVDHGTFQDQISSYLQGTPDDVFTWFSGFRMRFFAAQGLATDISDVWAKVGDNYTRRVQGRLDRRRRQAVLHPDLQLPVGRLLPQERLRGQGLHDPDDLRRAQDARRRRCKTDGLIPFAFGDKDGWPAMGTFDILNLRLNGYDFHVGLMAGKEKWTDPKVKAVFDTWKELLPVPPGGRRRPDLAGRRRQALVQKKAGDVLPRDVRRRSSSRRPARPTSTTSTSSRIPTSGPQFDAEKALDAPIDGFMLSARRRTNHRRRQGVPRVPRPAGDPGRLGVRRTRATSRREGRRHERLHAAPEEGRRGHRRRPADHPVPRPRHQPELRRRRTACRRSCSTSSRTPTRTSTRS